MVNVPQLTQATNFLTSLTNPNFNFGNKKEILRVNGVEEAKNFKLEKGENVALVDCNDDILYVKSCDDIGHVDLKIYECVDKTTEYLSKTTPANISRAEFDGLKDSLAELKSLLLKTGGKKDEHNASKQPEPDLFSKPVQ